MPATRLIATTLFAVLVSTILDTQAIEAGNFDVAAFEKALSLVPDLENGSRIFHQCATCHGPEGWGREGSDYPQIAGQLRHVIIKQLIDISDGNRGNPMMRPFTRSPALRNAQDIADVAGYISKLPMTNQNEKGPGFGIENGKRLYQENCVDCHGEHGEGDEKEAIPQLFGRHFSYLVKQFIWIKVGRRKNADSDMVEQIQGFSTGDISDLMDYLSR